MTRADAVNAILSMLPHGRAAQRRTLHITLALTVLGVAACRPSTSVRTVDVHASDYAFRVPASLPAGPTAFRLINDGTVWHEVQLFRFRPGTQAAEAARFLAADSIPDAIRDSTGGVLIAASGLPTRQELLLSLAHGELYGLLCDFRDGPRGMPHARLGMFALIRVY